MDPKPTQNSQGKRAPRPKSSSKFQSQQAGPSDLTMKREATTTTVKTAGKEEVLGAGLEVGKGDKQEKVKRTPEDPAAKARENLVELIRGLRKDVGFNDADEGDPLQAPSGFAFHHHLSATNLTRMLDALSNYHNSTPQPFKSPPPSGIDASGICPFFVNTRGETIKADFTNIHVAPLFEESGEEELTVKYLKLEKVLEKELSHSVKKQAHMATATLRSGLANEAEFKVFVSHIFTDFLYYAFHGFFKVQSEMPLPPVEGVLNYGRVEIGVAPDRGCPVMMTVELKKHGGDHMPQLLGEIAACYGKNFAGLLAPSTTFHMLWEGWDVKVYRARYTSNGKFELALIQHFECYPPWPEPSEEIDLHWRQDLWSHFYKVFYVVAWKAIAFGTQAIIMKSQLRTIAGDINSTVSSAGPTLPARQKKQIIEGFVSQLAQCQQRLEEFSKSQKGKDSRLRRVLKQISALLQKEQQAMSNEEKLAQMDDLVKKEQSELSRPSTSESLSSLEDDTQDSPPPAKRKPKGRSRPSQDHWEAILAVAKSHCISITSGAKSGKEVRFRKDLKTIFLHLRECYRGEVVVPDWQDD